MSQSSPKPFKTYEEQINILKERGLIFDNESDAYKFLEINNYYTVINGYKEPFTLSESDKFLPNTKFEYIKALYCFDLKLRHSVLSILLDVEATLKSIISYEFARLHGESGYLDIANYEQYSDFDKMSKTQEFIENLQMQIENWEHSTSISYTNIKHYAQKHGCIPVWVLCSHLNMSSISKFYSKLQKSTQQAICDHLVSVYNHPFNTTFLYHALRLLSDIRNLCAHNQRLYNFSNMHHLQARSNKFIQDLINRYGKDLEYDNIVSLVIVLYHLSTPQQLYDCFNGFVNECLDILNLPAQFTIALASNNKCIYTFIEILTSIIKPLVPQEKSETTPPIELPE